MADNRSMKDRRVRRRRAKEPSKKPPPSPTSTNDTHLSSSSSNAVPPPRPSHGARLTFQDLMPAQPPPSALFQPVIHRAVRDPQNIQLLPAVGCTDTPEDELPPVFLMRAQEDAQLAYARIPNKKSIPLEHAPGWGEVIFAIAYTRELHPNRPMTFRCPDPSRPVTYARKEGNGHKSSPPPTFVAIKKLRKQVVDAYLMRGHEHLGRECLYREDVYRENPYKEIARMQAIGDNQHVLACLEALEDDEFLYIVTPKACDQGSLVDVIPWFRPASEAALEPERIHRYFLQILHILAYLEKHGVHHRDLSPDNFIFLEPDHLVVMDLAMSVKLPTREGQRTAVSNVGNFGTHAWMAPEIFHRQEFDGVGADLWSATVILYNMLTNTLLYRLPTPADINFRYFIVARGLSSDPINERTVEILSDTFYGEDGLVGNGEGGDGGGSSNNEQHEHELLSRAMAHLSFSPAVKELFNGFLDVHWGKRWTLAQVMESAYVQSEHGSGA